MNSQPSYTLCRTPKCRTRPEPGYADRGLCDFHEREGLEAIEALPGDWAQLQPLIFDKAQLGLTESAGPAPFGPTLPFDLAVDALAREVAYTAVVWEIPVRERAGLSDSIGQDVMCGGPELAAACRTLTAHYAVLVALGPVDYMGYDRRAATADGPDAVVQLTTLHRRAVASIGMRERVTDLPGTCPDCNWPTLKHRDGSETVWCDHCRGTWPWNDYQDRLAFRTVRAA